MRTAVACVVLLCSASSLAGVAYEPFVRTETRRPDGSGNFASGICFANTPEYMRDGKSHHDVRILSCAHGRRLGDPVKLMFVRRQVLEGAWVEAIDYERDLSVIRTPVYPSLRYYPFLHENYVVPVGQTVRMVGFSRNTVDKRSTIIGYQKFTLDGKETKYPLVRIDGDGAPGDSGGPLLYRNFLMGIDRLRVTSEGTNHDAGFVRHVEIHEFLHENKMHPDDDEKRP